MPSEVINKIASNEDAIQYIYRTYGDAHSVYSADARELTIGRDKYNQYIIDRFFPSERDAEILEVGCGDGKLLQAALNCDYTNILGIDASPSMIEIARRRVAQSDGFPAERIQMADATDFLENRPSGKLDLVVAIDVVEHFQLYEILNFLFAVKRALKPGGKLLLHVPNGSSSHHGRVLHGDITHYRAFTDKSLHQLAQIGGFHSLAVFESAPVKYGLKSKLRALLWALARSAEVTKLAFETGQVRGHILTINLFALMTK
jgi:cyclopropane fatty-acyl-phospholipid synthase-like methyltransferase